MSGFYLWELNTYVNKKARTRIVIEALFITGPKLGVTQMSIKRWINKIRYIHPWNTTQQQKRNERLIHMTTQKYWRILFLWSFKTGTTKQMWKIRTAVASTGEDGIEREGLQDVLCSESRCTVMEVWVTWVYAFVKTDPNIKTFTFHCMQIIPQEKQIHTIWIFTEPIKMIHMNYWKI